MYASNNLRLLQKIEMSTNKQHGGESKDTVCKVQFFRSTAKTNCPCIQQSNIRKYWKSFVKTDSPK